MGLYTKPGLEARLKEFQRTVAFESVNESINKVLLDQRKKESFDIFLSHSYLDKKYILVLKLDIESMGFSVYVDWDVDSDLDRTNVTKKTANLIRKRMKSCTSLLFATSQSSPKSKWMPWELGYFDGMGRRVAILPILDDAVDIAHYEGQEYLSLYPFVSKEISANSSNMVLMIHDHDSNNCHSIDCWLKLR